MASRSHQMSSPRELCPIISFVHSLVVSQDQLCPIISGVQCLVVSQDQFCPIISDCTAWWRPMTNSVPKSLTCNGWWCLSTNFLTAISQPYNYTQYLKCLVPCSTQIWLCFRTPLWPLLLRRNNSRYPKGHVFYFLRGNIYLAKCYKCTQIKDAS